MAQYLLKAHNDDMAAWKDAAKREGVSFAVFIRQALARHAAFPTVARQTPITDMRQQAQATTRSDMRQDTVSGKRSYAPDPR